MILAHFIDMEQYQTIGKFYNAEQEISLAYDSTLVIVDTTNTEYADSVNEAIKLYHLNNALSYISDINSTLQSIQYYQSINQLYISYLKNDSLNESELQTAKDIAAQCIYTYGAAVSNARSLVSLLDSTATWNDNYTCFGNMRTANTDNEYDELIAKINEERLNVKKAITNNSSIFLYPNPADKYLDLQFTDNEVGYKIIFYNYLGTIQTSKLISNKMRFDVEEWNNGLYLYSIFNNTNELVSKGKITIIHK
ncbi:MAG: Secretion system C-terminal sorting domain [Bacteroidota bacterium]|jgi:hypothetical protein